MNYKNSLLPETQMLRGVLLHFHNQFLGLVKSILTKSTANRTCDMGKIDLLHTMCMHVVNHSHLHSIRSKTASQTYLVQIGDTEEEFRIRVGESNVVHCWQKRKVTKKKILHYTERITDENKEKHHVNVFSAIQHQSVIPPSDLRRAAKF